MSLATVETCNQTKAALIGVACKNAPPTCSSASLNAENPTIQFDYDTTYRLRFIGATSLMYVSLAILEPIATPYDASSNVPIAMEKMTLIEADGSYLDPLENDYLDLRRVNDTLRSTAVDRGSR